MAKSNIGLYLTDGLVYLCTKDKIYEEVVDKDIVINNKVAKSQEFYHFMNKIIKKYKLNDSILGRNIAIFSSPNYLDTDKELLRSIMEKLSFKITNFIKYNEIITDITIINYNNSNTIFTLSKQNYFLPNTLIEKFNLYNAIIPNIKSLEIFIIGQNQNIKKLANYLEKEYSKKVYTYSNSEVYIIENIQKILD